jgi:phthalate 4,5-dioxygenase
MICVSSELRNLRRETAMITREENEFLTRIGSGTPMGQLLRRYWMPVALSSELPAPDSPPVKVGILGEKLVAFRDSRGRVGLLDQFCAHRRASLFLGRNEEGGLRCIYHGWKYDVEGKCLEMPSEPSESTLKERISLKSYPTIEMGAVIWAYMGPKEKIPPPPQFEWTQVPESRRVVGKVWEECNWLQALEGNFDTMHPAFLHKNLRVETQRAGVNPLSKIYYSSFGVVKLAQQEIVLTDYGFYYAAIRTWDERSLYVNVNHFVMPFHQIRSTTSQGKTRVSMIEGHIPVPIDDENCMDYVWRFTLGDDPIKELEAIEAERGRGEGEAVAGFRKVRSKDKDWLIDRNVQKSETYSGIEGVNTQDHAVQESMGPIVDRTQENLGSSDKSLFAVRNLLKQGAKLVQEGKEPLGLGTSYYAIRPTIKTLSADVSWREVVMDEIRVGR